jgi:hypothetical protein
MLGAMRAPILFLGLVALLGASSSARAEDGPRCTQALDDSQVKRDDGKLIEARKLLRFCGGADCTPTLQRLCSQLLADVDARVPSFVLSAKDGSGGDLVNVRVTMDGAQVATTLDGRAIEVDPGPHSFVFELPDGTKAEKTAVAEERVKGTVVSVTFGALPPAPPQVAAPPQPVESVTDHGGSPLKTAGFVLGAAGVVGLGLGIGFGVEALSTKSSNCPSNDQCAPGTPSTAYSQARISTVSFVAGGTLLASGVSLLVLAPRAAGDRRAARWGVEPVVAASGGGLRLAGEW